MGRYAQRISLHSLINHKLVYCSPPIVKNNANDYFQSNFPGRLIFALASQHIQQLNNYHGNKHENLLQQTQNVFELIKNTFKRALLGRFCDDNCEWR